MLKKARVEDWQQAKGKELVEKKVKAIKAMKEVEAESKQLPLTLQFTFDEVVRERLRAEGLLVSLDVAIAAKGIELLRKTSSPEDLETISRARRNLAPPQPKTEPQTTVNVTQTQATAVMPQPIPQAVESMRRILRGDFEGDE